MSEPMTNEEAMEAGRRRGEALTLVEDERDKQDAQWGCLRDFRDGTGGGGRETYERIAKLSCERAERESRMTWAHIFEEEAAEVLAVPEGDVAKLRAELIQVAAVAVAWIEALSNRGRSCADCGYEHDWGTCKGEDR